MITNVMARSTLLHSILILVCQAPASVMSQRSATVHEVQPGQLDTVHAVWLNGPTHSGQLGNGWPTFSDDAGTLVDECTARDDVRYTGYSNTGVYCENSSPMLDNQSHLLIQSGRLGVVVDVRGLLADASSNTRNLMPKFGALPPHVSDGTAREIFEALPNSATNITMTLAACSSEADNAIYTLGVPAGDKAFVHAVLVRQGHTVTQATLSNLEFQSAISGTVFGPCANFVSEQQVDSPNCNGSPDWPCDTAPYTDCQGFVQGVSWGRCWSVCTAATDTNNLWGELSVWGDSVTFELAWDAGFDLPAGCQGNITVSLHDGKHEGSANANTSGRISLMFSAPPNAGEELEIAQPADHRVVVTSDAGTVVTRSATQDVFVEVPTSTARCGYDLACADIPMMLVDVQASNPSAWEQQTLRLSFSRNFETRDNSLVQSGVGAEITGLSVQLWDTETLQPTGIPLQLSKNWHVGSSVAYWAGFDGYWWTANALLRLPPNTTIALSLALSYEKYGGVSAWSHAQLSLVGYSKGWLWEQAALGTGGESICFDPLGTHTRAFITDVRPKLFDGRWKQNVGGGDFLQMFGADGKLQYHKELDPQLHTSGPCLSDAQYRSVTADGSISQHVRIRGGRTDDLVRVWMDVRVEVLQSTSFSRLFFYQMGSETYSYYALFERFVWGSEGSGERTELLRSCDAAGAFRHYDKLYSETLPLRVTMNGTAPWWFAFENNTDSATIEGDGGMVVGDRGLIIRRYSARLGGEQQTAPSFSILCDKVELGTPAGLRSLSAGDFVDMSLEFVVLPRAGPEFELALENSASPTLARLANMTTSERVRAQAVGGELQVTAWRGVERVEGRYPVHVVAINDDQVMFEVGGAALGYVPVVIAGLSTSTVPAGHGLWLRGRGETNFTRLVQGSEGFWQANFDRQTGLYSLVFNVEIFASTTIAFGSDPHTWPPVDCAPGLMADAQHACVPSWGKDERFDVAACRVALAWEDKELKAALLNGSAATGGLGNLMEDDFEVWLCFERHGCTLAAGLTAEASAMCFVYNETSELFVPWDSNARLQLVEHFA